MNAYDRVTNRSVGLRADLLCCGLCSRKGLRKQKKVAALSGKQRGYDLINN